MIQLKVHDNQSPPGVTTSSAFHSHLYFILFLRQELSGKIIFRHRQLEHEEDGKSFGAEHGNKIDVYSKILRIVLGSERKSFCAFYSFLIVGGTF